MNPNIKECFCIKIRCVAEGEEFECEENDLEWKFHGCALVEIYLEGIKNDP